MNLNDIKKEIPDNPRDRIANEMLAKFDAGTPFMDIHTHIFTLNDVPAKFIGIRIPMTRRFVGGITRFMYTVGKIKNRDRMSGMPYFLATMKDRSSEAVYRRMDKVYYHDKYPDAVYGVLTMDMGVGIDGGTHNTLLTQLGNVAMIRNVYPDKVVPFACIDPRRKDALEIFEKAFSAKMPYKYYGLKVYPSLGYLPSHPVLMQMLEICEEKDIPVLTHCSSGSTHGSNKKQTNEGTFVNYDGSQDNNHSFKSRPFKKKTDYRDFYNRPHHWDPVLKKHPKLRLNIAHFGGGEAWRDYISGKDKHWVNKIIGQTETYDNVYSDFSYTLYKSEYSIKLKELMNLRPKLKDKVLFGSDYYMLVIEEDYRNILAKFESDMGPELMEKLARTNNRAYLGL